MDGTPGVRLEVCANATVTGKVRYVSLAGQDATGDGSLARPYRTLAHAARMVQAHETILVRGGTYREPEEIRLRVPSVTIRSVPGEWAMIDRSEETGWNSGVDFDVDANAGVLTCIEVRGGFYVVSTETRWDWGDPDDRSGSSHIRIEDTRLHGSLADVIKIKPNSDDLLIRHNEIFDSGIGQDVDDCNAEGIDNVNGDRVQVAYNHIHDICSTGVYLKGGSTDGVVEHNLIEHTGAAGILLGFDTSPEYFDLQANPDYYENIRGIARYNLIRDVGWAGVGFYASKDAQAYNNTILDAAQRYHSPLYFGLSYQDWEAHAGRPPNLRPRLFRNLVSQSAAVTSAPPYLVIRYADDLGGMSALSGSPTMSDNCYYQTGGAGTFEDRRTDWSGDLAAWQGHIGGDQGSYEVDPQLDAELRPLNALCAGRGHLGAEPVPAKPVTLAPAGTITTNLPTYRWHAVGGATWYQLWVSDAARQGKIQNWYSAAQSGCASGTGSCAIQPATPLVEGKATWWVRGWNEAGYGPWSDRVAFSVSLTGGYPVKVPRLWPVSGAQIGQASKLWAEARNAGADPLAADTRVWYYVSGPGWTDHWVGFKSAGGLSGGATAWYGLDWTIPATATAGSYRYWVRVYRGNVALSDWSQGQRFSVAAATSRGNLQAPAR